MFTVAFSVSISFSVLFFWSAVNAKLVSNIRFWSTRRAKSYISHNTLCYFDCIKVYVFSFNVLDLTKYFLSTTNQYIYLLVLCLHSLNRNRKKIENKDSPIFNLFVDFKEICRFLIILSIWKRLTDLNFFCGFEKESMISNYFVDLKKICRFLIFLWIWKGFLDLKLFLWIGLKTIDLFKK